MRALEITDVFKMERRRSSTYIKHAESLLSLAENDLFGEDGDIISLQGLRKLKDKVTRINSK